MTFPDLKDITRPMVDTAAAAYYLYRRPQTLRYWACTGTGPIQPKKVYGKNMWSVDEIKKILGVA